MQEPQTFINQYLDGLSWAERDTLSNLAFEALDLMQTHDPASYDRLYEVMKELRPALEALARDGNETPQTNHPATVCGRYAWRR